MKYMFLVYLDEKVWAARSEAEQQRAIAECSPYIQQLRANGKYLAGAPLHPTSMATTVSVENGKPLVTDGPFAETREQLGGYNLIEANDLDEAISIASRLVGKSGAARIEIRPVAEIAATPTH